MTESVNGDTLGNCWQNFEASHPFEDERHRGGQSHIG